MAARTHVAILAERIAITHRHLIEAAQAGTDDDLALRAGPTSPPIAFHLWHAGRWADRWAEALSGHQQRWNREGLTTKWGFPEEQGEGGTGMQLSDDEAALPAVPRSRPAGDLPARRLLRPRAGGGRARRRDDPARRPTT